MRRQKIGIMGGTFNPIHMGHLMLAECAYSDFKLDKILFIPNGKSYMKDNVLDTDVRLCMTKLAIEFNDHFEISTIEIERSGNSYTYETLELLTQHNPDVDYYLILGADSVANIDKWKCPQRIFDKAKILCAYRSGISMSDLQLQIDYLTDKYNADIQLMKMKTIEITSTDIRNNVKLGKSIRYMVPNAVYDYIMTNNLYI